MAKTTKSMAKSHKDITDVKDLTITKPYLSIGEVAEKFDVSVDLLRKWERAFPSYIRPRRSAGNTRSYSLNTIKQIAVIYRLMRVDGLTVEGAKRRLKEDPNDINESRQEVIQRLQMLKQELLGVIDELEKAKAPVQAETGGEDKPFVVIY